MRNRVDVMHGVNFDVLERRALGHYGGLTLTELEVQVKHYARELGLEATFFQTNHEGEFCEQLHRSSERADGLLVNAGAWSHYSYAIRDALEVAGVPAVEVHLSNIEEREDWRRVSVVADVVSRRVIGKGPEGYREALEFLSGKKVAA
jgi:3-dehydroquinate dehydratase II